MFDLTGRTALVTGAGQNIGAGIARALGAAGATVLVNDLRSERAEEVVEALVADSHAAVAVAFDVTDRAAIDAAVAEAGPIDVLVNNAGNGGAEAMLPKKFADTDPDDWRGPMEVNLQGVLHCCHAVLPGMVERGHGRIITISSAAGTHGVGIGFAPYSVGKGGSLSLMRSLALEHGRDGITANSVATRSGPRRLPPSPRRSPSAGWDHPTMSVQPACGWHRTRPAGSPARRSA
jgi:3-oxoacyl-[acyl-carrier protein] reductase